MSVVKQSVTILQGTTQRVPFVRRYVDYAIQGDECSGYTKVCDGSPVPPEDFRDEDYTGCTARMQLRSDIDSEDVLWEMSTDAGNIELDGNTLTLVFAPDESSAFDWENAVGQIEVTRANGDVERQYEIKFKLDRESTL